MALWRVYGYEADGELHTKLISSEASKNKQEDLDFFAVDGSEKPEFRGEVEIEDDDGLLDSDESFDS
jgi:hypothetical protein